MSIKRHILSVVLLILACLGASAQQAGASTVLPPLFEYPVAPESIEDWGHRSSWLVEHFWDNFNFKQKSVGQAQLNHAFKTWVIPMRFATATSVNQSVDHLLSNLKKQPGLLLQFVMAAERNIYDPATADVFIDEIYLKFLHALKASKKISEVRKARYVAQLASLEGCLTGDKMKPFDYADVHGEATRFTPGDRITLIEFGDPECSDCLMLKLHMETDDLLSRAIADGKVQVLFIIPDLDPEEGDDWKEAAVNFPATWTLGAASELDTMLDLRSTPSLYLIDDRGIIVSKNADYRQALELAGATRQ